LDIQQFSIKGVENMTLLELKKKVLALIEELNPNSEVLTDDPDIATKINEVINQVMYELARMKKIPKYVEMAVTAGDTIDFEAIEKACGYEVYQIGMVGGVNVSVKGNGTILKVHESGTAELDVFVYPERITEKTKDKAYEFELSPDVLEIMPYGVAAHILMSDVSADSGKVYADQYERMLQRLDSRYHGATTIYIDGGVSL
jgi:hypothetical protein